ncbi:ribosomal RNA small subunit methyltransferase A [Infirmifilum lucidum]|uniref:Ribosomal RNA small subunit methyltransferase A n=1 Tax=Infirmifilum lucidum TaxID=2776706 RepID=A0A7L9FEC2_9CREN|nr:16S rRNA (adenine(1518)-N(6)/adenine(1519)-N(6))-dimethyltransferase RsmA [Infirmifilum lucidum]QOJ78140.1 ribosomal RNA small subunit methyltransferase A [Infirmifilum lucidum]
MSECLKRAGRIRLQKRLGQHLLVDRHYIDLFVGATGSPRVVYEIGCGLGSLTMPLAERAEYVFCSEIDPGLASLLRECSQWASNVDVLLSDAMCLELSRSRHVVVSNTPFYLSSEVVSLLCRDGSLEYAVLGVQKEVGDRLLAQPGSRKYGRLSVIAQLCFSVEKLFIIPSSAYIPRPEVDTMVVRLTPTRAFTQEFLERLEEFTRRVFPYRKKKFSTGLSLGLGVSRVQAKELLSDLGIDPEKRVYEISPREVAKIVSYLALQA